MSNKKEITLYYADWCGHCRAFKPAWDALKGVFNDHGIKTHEYEADSNKELIKKVGIKGYPTLMINDNGKSYEYSGDRSVDSLLKEMGIVPEQHGGGDYYKQKYLKYKKKYMDLKKKLNE